MRPALHEYDKEHGLGHISVEFHHQGKDHRSVSWVIYVVAEGFSPG